MAGIVAGLRKILRGVLGSDENHLETSIGQTSSSGAADTALGAQKAKRAPTQGLHSDPRRYKRALLLTGGAGIQQKIASASADYRGQSFPVVDLSHTGVAIDRGEISDSEMPDPTKPEPMVLNVGVLEPFPVQVTLARSSDRVIAFEFVDVTTDGRLTIDRFLDPKMIGLNMRAVDRSFFSPGETFSLWFCGPRDTNFFLWMNDRHLERAILQLGDEQFTLSAAGGEADKIRFVRNTANTRAGAADLRDSVLFALDVALQVKNGGDSISELVKFLTDVADNPPSGV